VIAALKAAGTRVDALISSQFRPGASAPANRLGFAQAVRSLDRRLLPEAWRLYLNGLPAAPFGLRAAPVELVRNAKGETTNREEDLTKLQGIDRCFAAYDLFINARQHAIRWNKLLPIQLSDSDKPDIFHAMQIAPIKVAGRPCVVTIHDIIPLVLAGSTRDNLGQFSQFVKTILREADHVITVSEHSRRDLIEVLGGDERRITNTYQPYDVPRDLVERSHVEMGDDLAFYGLEPDSYFLFLGAIEPKKNVRRLVEAFAGSGSKRTLALVGGLGWDYEDDLRAIADPRFERQRLIGDLWVKEQQVRRLSYVPRPQLISLILGARALLFPSLYEGFGLPVLEALALGTPVMTSDNSSLPEIAGDAAVLVSPHDALAMAKAIRQLDRDDDLTGELRRRGPLQAAKFSAAAHAGRLAQVYRELR
jgi:glycosyltransferase involved in cell wall biosynthesis